MKKIHQYIVFALLLALSGCAETEQSEPGLVIENAMIYDGSGGRPYQGSVRVSGNQITEVGDVSAGPNDTVYDAAGLALSPGFIDPHSHHDRNLMQSRAAKSILAQGITTIVAGLDGGLDTFGIDDFNSIQNNFEIFEKTPAAVNLGLFAPHGTYRGIALGSDNKRVATAEELEQMKDMLRRDMEAGALGLSTGLEYEPAVYSDKSEVIDLAKVAAEYGGRYSSHIRSEDVAVFPAVEEAINIAREANIPVNISHIKLAMYELFGSSERVLPMLKEARAEGLNITADVYPYDGWQSVLDILIPSRDYYDRDAAIYALTSIIEPSSVIITNYYKDASYEGKTLAEIATLNGVTPVDQLMTMLQQGEKDGERIGVIGRNMGEVDIINYMQWPYTAITTDGEIDGSHPRGQGTFPRVLGRYIREKNVLSLEEAIRRMTSLAADNLGIKSRGLIKEGLAADIILFDPNTIIDHATFEDPLNYSTGVAAMWVNGTLVYEKGEPTENYPGKIIRRGD